MSIIDKTIVIFKDFKGAIKRELRAKQFRPLYSLAFLTYRCTSMCKCCNIWKRGIHNKKQEMGIEEWKVVIDKLYRSGVGGIEIFGGDALLRKDIIFDLIDYCRFRGINTYLPTNSNLLDRDTARLLVESGLTEIYFSLDGTQEVHDSIRGIKGSYRKIINAINEIVVFKGNREYPEIVINTTISKLNYNCIPDFLNDLLKLSINGVKLGYLSEVPEKAIINSEIKGITPDPYFVSVNGNSHVLSEEAAYRFSKIIKDIFQKRHSFPFTLLLDNVISLSVNNLKSGKFPRVRCLRTGIEPTITPYGDIIPCPFFSKYTLGNIYDSSLETIWGNLIHKRFVDAQKSGRLEICRYCNMLLFKKGVDLTFKKYLRRWQL
jgi:radical SAM protein with 4Fe4S-binding SPASM domain